MAGRINCPLCDWFHDDPGPNPESIDPMALAGVFGPGVFAAHALADHARKIEEILAAHFKTHTTVEWLTKVTALRDQLQRAVQWIQHGVRCASRNHSEYPCDCGLEAFLVEPDAPQSRFTDGHGTYLAEP